MRRAFRGGRPERLPPAPVNVRVVDEDGREYPVELAYVGRRGGKNGVDVWRATATVAVPGDRAFGVAADELPGRCSIEMNVDRRLAGDEP